MSPQQSSVFQKHTVKTVKSQAAGTHLSVMSRARVQRKSVKKSGDDR